MDLDIHIPLRSIDNQPFKWKGGANSSLSRAKGKNIELNGRFKWNAKVRVICSYIRAHTHPYRKYVSKDCFDISPAVIFPFPSNFYCRTPMCYTEFWLVPTSYQYNKHSVRGYTCCGIVAHWKNKNYFGK